MLKLAMRHLLDPYQRYASTCWHPIGTARGDGVPGASPEVPGAPSRPVEHAAPSACLRLAVLAVRLAPTGGAKRSRQEPVLVPLSTASVVLTADPSEMTPAVFAPRCPGDRWQASPS